MSLHQWENVRHSRKRGLAPYPVPVPFCVNFPSVLRQPAIMVGHTSTSTPQFIDSSDIRSQQFVQVPWVSCRARFCHNNLVYVHVILANIMSPAEDDGMRKWVVL